MGAIVGISGASFLAIALAVAVAKRFTNPRGLKTGFWLGLSWIVFSLVMGTEGRDFPQRPALPREIFSSGPLPLSEIYVIALSGFAFLLLLGALWRIDTN